MYKASTTPHKMGRMDQLPASHTTFDACINTQMTNEHSPKTHQYKVNAHPLSMSDMCKASTTPHKMGRIDQLQASHTTCDACRNTQITHAHTHTTHSYKLYSRCRYEKCVNNRQEHHLKWAEMDQLRAGHTSCDTSKNALKPRKCNNITHIFT